MTVSAVFFLTTTSEPPPCFFIPLLICPSNGDLHCAPPPPRLSRRSCDCDSLFGSLQRSLHHSILFHLLSQAPLDGIRKTSGLLTAHRSLGVQVPLILHRLWRHSVALCELFVFRCKSPCAMRLRVVERSSDPQR